MKKQILLDVIVKNLFVLLLTDLKHTFIILYYAQKVLQEKCGSTQRPYLWINVIHIHMLFIALLLHR